MGTIKVEKVILEPNYDSVETDWDMSLMKLEHPVELNDRVTPACFPTADQEFPPGQMCITTGWGTETKSPSKMLKQEYAELWSNEECNEAYWDYGWVTARMICAGFHLTGSEDPQRCASLGYGDSGGPLVCRAAGTGLWTSVGVTSWGGFCEDDNYSPGAFARVQNMRKWVEDTMDANMD